MEGSSHSKFVAHNIITTSNIHYCDTRVLLGMDRRYMKSLKLDSLQNNAPNYEKHRGILTNCSQLETNCRQSIMARSRDMKCSYTENNRLVLEL